MEERQHPTVREHMAADLRCETHQPLHEHTVRPFLRVLIHCMLGHSRERAKDQMLPTPPAHPWEGKSLSLSDRGGVSDWRSAGRQEASGRKAELSRCACSVSHWLRAASSNQSWPREGQGHWTKQCLPSWIQGSTVWKQKRNWGQRHIPELVFKASWRTKAPSILRFWPDVTQKKWKWQYFYSRAGLWSVSKKLGLGPSWSICMTIDLHSMFNAMW